MKRPLVVGGLVPFSSVDFPDSLAAVVFCQGCPWRCSYCHNPHLIPRCRDPAAPSWAAVLHLLRHRRGLLDAVVFSGGEPTLQAGLLDAIEDVRELGYRVGLHTAGPYPERLDLVLPYVDWVGFDVKAPFRRYKTITSIAGSGRRARESLERLLASGVPYTLRTTVDRSHLGDDDLSAITSELAGIGASRPVWQECRPLPT